MVFAFETFTISVTLCLLYLPPPPHALVWSSLERVGDSLDKQDLNVVSSVQSLSHVWLFVTPWTAVCQASLSFTNSWSLLKLMSFESMMPSNHLILCHPLLFLPSIFPNIRVFSNKSALDIRWPKYWSFSFSISPSNKYSGLTSFVMDCLYLLAVQGTLKSLLQHHHLKASIIRHSAFFMVQRSHSYYWKNHSLDWTELCRKSDVSAF